MKDVLFQCELSGARWSISPRVLFVSVIGKSEMPFWLAMDWDIQAQKDMR